MTTSFADITVVVCSAAAEWQGNTQCSSLFEVLRQRTQKSQTFIATSTQNPKQIQALESTYFIAIDKAGKNAYFTNQWSQFIRTVDLQTNRVSCVEIGDESNSAQNSLRSIRGMVFDSSGRFLFFCDHSNSCIQKVDLVYNRVTLIAKLQHPSLPFRDGKAPSEASIYQPIGLAIDSHDNLYFCDSGNNRIRRYDAQTNCITTVAGNGKKGDVDGCRQDAEFKYLWDIKVNPANEKQIFVSDILARKIKKIDLASGQVCTIVKSSPDIEYPMGIDISFDHNLYICDRYKHTIFQMDLISSKLRPFSGAAPSSTKQQLADRHRQSHQGEIVKYSEPLCIAVSRCSGKSSIALIADMKKMISLQ